jgi:hypothetical protein
LALNSSTGGNVINLGDLVEEELVLLKFAQIGRKFNCDMMACGSVQLKKILV